MSTFGTTCLVCLFFNLFCLRQTGYVKAVLILFRGSTSGEFPSLVYFYDLPNSLLANRAKGEGPMPVIKRLVRMFRRLRLFVCGFLRGKPLLCMHLQRPRSCRILISPGDCGSVTLYVTTEPKLSCEWYAAT